MWQLYHLLTHRALNHFIFGRWCYDRAMSATWYLLTNDRKAQVEVQYPSTGGIHVISHIRNLNSTSHALSSKLSFLWVIKDSNLFVKCKLSFTQMVCVYLCHCVDLGDRCCSIQGRFRVNADKHVQISVSIQNSKSSSKGSKVVKFLCFEGSLLDNINTLMKFAYFLLRMSSFCYCLIDFNLGSIQRDTYK